MKYIVKAVAGVLYMLATYLFLVICTMIVFIWELNIISIKELWEGHYVFYKKLLFKSEELEMYRYNTVWDYVTDNKDYSHRSTLFIKPEDL